MNLTAFSITLVNVFTSLIILGDIFLGLELITDLHLQFRILV